MNTKTLLYILKRIAMAVLTVWVVITVTFFVTRAVPGGPFMGEKAITEAAQAALEAKYGLDKPVMEQYFTYLSDVLTRLDFGPSLKMRGLMVIDVIADGLKTSVKLGVIAAFTALGIGVVLGSVAALRRNTILDKCIMVITTAFVSMPSFIMGTLLLLCFAVILPIFPANGSTTEGLVLPIVTLSLYPMAYITRLTRSSMLDVLGQDYIRTARAKGVAPVKIIFGHALKNSLIPVITYFGPSLKMRGRMVIDVIADGLKTSVKLGVIAAFTALGIGVVLGSVAALRRNTILDKCIMVITTAFVSMPSFIMGTLLLLCFAVIFPIFPANGSTTEGLVLPIITLSLYPMAYITRLTRSSMLDVLGQDYIRTARAKGVAPVKIIFGHALKNSLIPVITYFGPMLAYIVTGSLVVEQIFAVPGIGRAFVSSITNRDYPMIMGTTIVLACLIVIMNLVSDILYKVVDPRITLE